MKDNIGFAGAMILCFIFSVLIFLFLGCSGAASVSLCTNKIGSVSIIKQTSTARRIDTFCNPDTVVLQLPQGNLFICPANGYMLFYEHEDRKSIATLQK